MAAINKFYNEFDMETLGKRTPDPYRTPFQADRDRVIHSYAFRRLQAKTQVFRPGEYDFYRTRLTHTMEVAQIGRSICTFLNNTCKHLSDNFHLDADLVEAVCLAHDIGHAPFGHAGERALNTLMRDSGGFEGNAQTLRLLTEIIWHGSLPGERIGLSPTRALMDGVMKYKRIRPTADAPNQFIYNEQERYVAFVHGHDLPLDKKIQSIECQIMDWADDVAYSIGDLLDGVHARFITSDRLAAQTIDKEIEPLADEIRPLLGGADMSRFAARKIGQFIQACRIEDTDEYPSLASRSNRYRYKLVVPSEKRVERKFLARLSRQIVFESPVIQQLEYKAQRMIEDVFRILSDNYSIDGPPTHHLLNGDIERMIANAPGRHGRARQLCDHVSGMSDDYLVRTWRRLMDPEFGSIVDLV